MDLIDILLIFLSVCSLILVWIGLITDIIDKKKTSN